MCAETIPDIRPELRAWLIVGLWCCLGFFTFELAVRLWTRSASERRPSYLFSAAGVIDALAVLPIPIALLAGVPTETAWLLASLWLLKLTTLRPRIVPALARHFTGIESAGERVRHLSDRFAAGRRRTSRARARGTAGTVRQLAPVALVGGNDADDHRLRRRGAGNIPWPSDRRHGDDLRARRVRAVDRYSRHRLRGRASAPRFRPHLGSGDARAVFPQSLSGRDRRTHAHAATGWTWRREPSWCGADGLAIACISSPPARSR